MISVFMPCTPNPTTGFFFYIAADEVVELPISADDAAKLIMSAGLIQPQGHAALAAMAEAAKLNKRTWKPRHKVLSPRRRCLDAVRRRKLC
jgi:uncharacterized membrane protein